LGEETKVAVRTIRRDAIEEFRKQEKKSEITKDDLAVAEKDVQDLTDKYTAEVDKIVEAKIEEIMEV
jgi:ribosome recycling factor